MFPRHEAVRLLKLCFPTSLFAMNEPCDLLIDLRTGDSGGKSQHQAPVISMVIDNAMNIIDHADRFNIRTVLPAAFYYCAINNINKHENP